MVHGYILINAEKGKALDVVAKVAKIKGVESACAVTGAYDVIATFEVKDVTEIADLVVKGIHSIEGICCTQTAVCVKC